LHQIFFAAPFFGRGTPVDWLSYLVNGFYLFEYPESLQLQNLAGTKLFLE
jgi:hypothetical protein